jgi:hypothetical protein
LLFRHNSPEKGLELITTHVRNLAHSYAKLQLRHCAEDKRKYWLGVSFFKFGGFRRLENLEQTSKKEAVLEKETGKPIELKIEIEKFKERGVWVHEGGFIHLRLHKVQGREQWFVITTKGSHGLRDSRGNVRSPWLTAA